MSRRTAKVLEPKDVFDDRFQPHRQLDARIIPKNIQHEDLAMIIRDSVERTQRPIMTELPDQLILTQGQLASLNNWTEAMADTEDRLFLTPFNIMEVIVDREHVDDTEAASQTVQWLEEIEELEAAHAAQEKVTDEIDQIRRKEPNHGK